MNKRTNIITVAIVLVVSILITIYVLGRKSAKNGKTLKISQSDIKNDVPKEWDPNFDAQILHSAIEGMGTDEEAIYGVLQNKNKTQLKLIYNAFNLQYNEDLFEWFSDDLSDEDLTRVMGYFQGIY